MRTLLRASRAGFLVLAVWLALTLVAPASASASHVRTDHPGWTTASVNLRSGPSTAYRVLEVLPARTKVAVLSRASGTHWYRVSLASAPTRVGYVSGAYLAGAARYIFPVQPSGSASYGPCHHDYPATDVFAPVGLQFVAVTSGTVDVVSRTDHWDPRVDDPATRSGIAVAIVGTDGVRYYGSHLSSVAGGVAPGLRVRAGQLLGLTGRSGNARGTPAHTHFGISRPTTPDDWQGRRGHVAPARFLDAWPAGRLATPDLTVPPSGVC